MPQAMEPGFGGGGRGVGYEDLIKFLKNYYKLRKITAEFWFLHIGLFITLLIPRLVTGLLNYGKSDGLDFF